MIHIFIVSTASYFELFTEKRINSLNNLFPDKEKTLNLISDNNHLDKFKNILNDKYIDFKYYHICNLPYPFITFHKFDYCYDMCKENNYNDNDYFLYLDSHSYCIEKSKEYWDNIYSNLENYDICYALNPYRKQDIIFDEIDERAYNYVTKKELEDYRDYYCQCSFMMGNIKGLFNFKNAINSVLVKDIFNNEDFKRRNPIIPRFAEQHYANYIFYDILLRNKDYNFSIYKDDYVSSAFLDINERSFIICHYENIGDFYIKHFNTQPYNPYL